MLEYEIPSDCLTVVFDRYGTSKLSGTAQNTAQKEENTAQKND